MDSILALDGGGVRGVVSCRWLEGVPVERFSLYAGTSTGALIACGLAAGLPVAGIGDLYRTRGGEIFEGGLWRRLRRMLRDGISVPKYDGEGLARLLREVFGSARLGDLKPVMVVAYDTLARKPVVFKSWLTPRVPVWQACMASTAAPTYFPAHVMEVDGRAMCLIDGGVVANNPTACAVAEAMRMGKAPVVLSVGTGERTAPIPAREAREWGALEWAPHILSVFMDGGIDAQDYIARTIAGERYVRLQHELPAGLGRMDDASLIPALDGFGVRTRDPGKIERIIGLLP